MDGKRSSDQEGAGKEAPQEVWRAELTPECEHCADCSRVGHTEQDSPGRELICSGVSSLSLRVSMAGRCLHQTEV